MKRAAFAAWLVLLLLAQAGSIALGPIESLLLLAILVVVPLGLSLGGTPPIVRYLQPAGAALAVLSFCLRPGWQAANLASGWLLVTLLVAADARNSLGSMEEICRLAARLYLPVGGFWLVVSRGGIRALGFQEPLVLLTAIHFHYAGFAAASYAGAAAGLVGKRPLYRWAAAGIVAAPPLVAAGFVFSLWMKVSAAALTAVRLTILSMLVLQSLAGAGRGIARALLAVSAGSVVAGMLLECVYAAGEVADAEWISISQMAVTHGVLNGLGFALCGLLGWSLTKKRA